MGSAQAPSLHSVAPRISLRVARIVDRSLAFDVDRRYPDAATMRSDVQAVLRGEDPPFASNLALKTEAPTSAQAPMAFSAAAAVAAVPAVAAMALEPTGAPSSFRAHPPLEPTGAPASFPMPAATQVPREPTGVTRTAPGGAEPTSFPVVIAQPAGSVTRAGGGAPPMAVFAAIGGAMLLLGVGVGAWVMLGDSPRAQTMDRVAAARIDVPDSADAVTEPTGAPTAEAESDGGGQQDDPSAQPTSTPKTPATTTPPPKPTTKPKNNSMKSTEGKGKGKGKGKKKKDD
jgi:hypothetical protein